MWENRREKKRRFRPEGEDEQRRLLITHAFANRISGLRAVGKTCRRLWRHEFHTGVARHTWQVPFHHSFLCHFINSKAKHIASKSILFLIDFAFVIIYFFSPIIFFHCSFISYFNKIYLINTF